MKNGNIDINLKNIGPAMLGVVQKLNRFAAIFFFLFVSCIYGFVVYRVNTLSNVQPDSSEVEAKSPTAKTPKIDPAVAKKLESMKDNSVNVRTLFEDARNNPFTE
jgi:hypothetical protein